MTNLLNTMTLVAEIFADKYESLRVLSKTVDTQIIRGLHNPKSGATVYLRRPNQYNVHNTDDGDLSTYEKHPIKDGNIPATVQQYTTVAIEWGDYEESLTLGDKEKKIQPAAERCIIDVESRLIQYAVNNLGVTTGSPGTAVTQFSDMAKTNAYLTSVGAGMDRYYVGNPYTHAELADTQAGLHHPGKVASAWKSAQMSEDIAGMKPLMSNALYSYQSGTAVDRVGAANAAPDATYATARNTMQQTIAIKSITASSTVKVGEVIEWDTVYACHPLNGQIIRDATGSPVKFRQTVLGGATVGTDATASGGGVVSVIVSPPALYETGTNSVDAAYRNVSAAIAEDDVCTILGAASTYYQPGIFYEKGALALGTVKLSKLYDTDINIETMDNMAIRVCRYADGDANKQMIRFDILPVFAVLNPHFGGRSFGYA